MREVGRNSHGWRRKRREKENKKRNVRGIFLEGEAGSEGGRKRRKNMKNGEKLRKSEKNKRQVVEEKVENFVEFFCYRRNFKCYQWINIKSPIMEELKIFSTRIMIY